jgi:hypothetical protein
MRWAITGADDRVAEFGLMLQNLAAVAANCRRPGGTYVLMDVNYSGVQIRKDDPSPFGLALSVSASVI